MRPNKKLGTVKEIQKAFIEFQQHRKNMLLPNGMDPRLKLALNLRTTSMNATCDHG